MTNLLSKEKVGSYIPIHLESLRLDTILQFDLFVKLDQQMVLYRSADLPFLEKTKQKLIENGLTTLFIKGESREAFQDYMATNLPIILQDPALPQKEKATVLYDTSKTLIEDIFANPTYNESIRRSETIVENTIDYLMHGREAFVNLMQITSYNYTLYTHSVNVCAFSISLAQQSGHTDATFLYELGIGALLHDIGKSNIPDRILNKKSKLSPTEFEIVKRHPKWGVEILRETDQIPEECYMPVLQHHERGGGTGYPDHIDLRHMHIYSKIVAICDAFDAMTTSRVYQDALDTYTALRIMNAQKAGFDQDLLRRFIVMLGPA
jgi:putative nucleotidyltransferase with HDIG domain